MNYESELTRIYSDAKNDLRTLLLNVDPKSFNGSNAFAIQEKTKKIIFRLNERSGRWTKSAVTTTYKTTSAKSRVALEILGRKSNKKFERPETSIESVRKMVMGYILNANVSIKRTVDRYVAVAVLASNTLKYTHVPIQEFAEEEFAGADEFIDDLAREAVASYKSSGWLYGQIKDYLRGMIEGDEIEINGRFYDLTKYARMVARTTLRESATKATLDRCREYDNDLVEVSDHNTDCKLCEEYEGRVYSLSGETPGYDVLPEETPFHPNCLHSILPTSIEAIEARAEIGQE